MVKCNICKDKNLPGKRVSVGWGWSLHLRGVKNQERGIWGTLPKDKLGQSWHIVFVIKMVLVLFSKDKVEAKQ